jgi:hypothetical protein
LILEYVAEDGSKQCKSYLLSDLSQAIGDMRLDVHDWPVSALAEISEEQLRSCFGAAEVLPWYSFLKIGPLRTAFSGYFACGRLSEAFAVIMEFVIFKLCSSPGRGCFPDFLFRIDRSTLWSIVDCPQSVSLN